MQSHDLAMTADGLRPDPNRILRSIGEAVYVWDMASDAIAWSDNAGEVLKLGNAAAIATGRDYEARLSPYTLSSRRTAVHNALGTDQGAGVPFHVVYGMTAPDRSTIWVEDTGNWFAGPDGRPGQVQGVVRIVTERYAEMQRLAYESRFDRLTGALNRQALIEQTARLAAARAQSRTPFAVLVAAVENLGLINRIYGYDVADALIAGVGKRLRGYMRGSDLLARYTGNKFALVLDSCDRKQMEAAAERLLKEMEGASVETPAGPLQAAVRIGGVMEAHGARGPEALLKRAEEALDIARENAAGRFAAYEPSLVRDELRRRTAEAAHDIVGALNGRRLFLACQPIVAALDGAPALYEGLMRIRREDGSWLLPESVLPIAEKVGLVQLIDHRVLELALAKLAEEPALTLAINVSATTALDPDWPARVAQAVAVHPGTGGRLIVELTETRAIEDVEATTRAIAALKALGVRVAMDDFGAGHTSFKNLRRLDLDFLKIDGGFIRNLAHSVDDRFFTRTLIDLARHIGIPVVAEWVEDRESVRLLTDWGVDYLQGNYFGAAAVELVRPSRRIAVA